MEYKRRLVGSKVNARGRGRAVADDCEVGQAGRARHARRQALWVAPGRERHCI
jgi:hypothetical protein